MRHRLCRGQPRLHQATGSQRVDAGSAPPPNGAGCLKWLKLCSLRHAANASSSSAQALRVCPRARRSRMRRSTWWSSTDITIIFFQPLLYQVATAGLSPADIASPIRAVLSKQRNTTVILADVSGVDTVAKTVHAE